MRSKSMDMSTFREARYWHREKEGIRCDLCPHKCYLKEGMIGICGVRINNNNTLYTQVYGLISSINMDPIEKKPLFHFHPGKWILSLSTVGCNFRCQYCQNYEISQARPSDFSIQILSPEDVVRIAKNEDSEGIAWTYNEPTIWYEFNLDTSKLAKKEGLYTVYVTNGYINEEPLKELAPYLDAMNIDVKGFTDTFYKKIVGGRLEKVLDTVKLAKKLGIHVELTYLIVPTLNDDQKQMSDYVNWVIENLGTDVPLHFSRFFPHYKLAHLSATPVETMLLAYKISKDLGANYVYLGNLFDPNYETTYCPKCSSTLIQRIGYDTKILNLTKNGYCKVCGTKIPFLKE